MIRKIIPIVITTLLISSCGSKSGKGTAEILTGSDKPVKVQFASLVENPGDYIDKNIIVEGKVVHVCLHTGKKMFIVGDNPDIMLYVSAGENTSAFPTELLGSKISVEGHLQQVITANKPIDEKINPGTGNAASSDTSSKSANARIASSEKTGAECETEASLVKQTVLADLMMVYNKHTLVK